MSWARPGSVGLGAGPGLRVGIGLVGLLAVSPQVRAASPAAGASSQAPAGQDVAPEGGEDEVAVAEPPGERPEARAKRNAREWFEKGVADVQAGRYVDAGEAFDASYEAIEAANTLYNAAWAYEHGQDWLRAALRYRRYLARYPKEADSAEVERALVRMEAELAELAVSVSGGTPPYAITIDGESVAPDAPPRLSLPGEVEVHVEDAGGHARDERVSLRPGQRRTLEVTFAEVAVADTAATGATGASGTTEGGGVLEGPTPDASDGVARSTRAQRPWARPLMWTGVSLAGAGTVLAATLGPLTRREANRFEGALCESPCPEGSVYPADIERRWRGLRAGTNVAIGVAALGASTALIFGLLGRASARAQGSSDAAARPRWSPGAGTVRLRF